MKDLVRTVLDFINSEILKRDRVYCQIKREQVNAYQNYFMMALTGSDIHNLTNYRFRKQPFDATRAKADYETADRIFMEAKRKDKLLPGILQVMFEQYILADPWMRESDRTRWIFRVMHRKDIDYFPDAVKVHDILFK